MNTQTILKIAASVIIYTLLQVFILRNLVFFDVAFCFVYISVILFLPSATPTSTALVIAFITGILVDMFYNTAGLHASAAVMIAFIRGLYPESTFSQPGPGERNCHLRGRDGDGAFYPVYRYPDFHSSCVFILRGSRDLQFFP
ncbi:MAG: hypothetical protein LRY55_02535 [Leadbetterella sp.]|nr:hypothetical protein [Leadbetterella sp.]